MTTIRTTCPRCGEVDMGVDTVRLYAQADGEGTYVFHCPKCYEEIEKRADRKIVALLISAGVEVIHLDEGNLPDASSSLHAKERLDTAPLTDDDLIAFHFNLENDEEIARELFGKK